MSASKTFEINSLQALSSNTLGLGNASWQQNVRTTEHGKKLNPC